MRKIRPQRRVAATRVLLSAALGFGASFALPVVFPESPTLRVCAADEAQETPLSDAELFAVPSEGQGVAFYQDRLKAIQARIREIRQTEGKDAAKLAKEKSREARVAERGRCAVAYREREKERGLDEAARLYVRPGQVRQGGRVVRAEPETADSRYFATVAELERRLADASELAPAVRGEHYLRYLAATTDAKPAADYWSPSRRRDFYAERAAEETSKTPVDWRRVVVLGDLIEREEEKIAKEPLVTEGYPTPLKADEIARLCDVPTGETAEFYRKRLAALNRVAIYAARSPRSPEIPIPTPTLRRKSPTRSSTFRAASRSPTTRSRSRASFDSNVTPTRSSPPENSTRFGTRSKRNVPATKSRRSTNFANRSWSLRS